MAAANGHVSSIDFRQGPDGKRSSSAAGRAIVSHALKAVDEAGARAAERETAWRSNYLVHFRRLVEAGLSSPEHWSKPAQAGLEEVGEQLAVVTAAGEERPLKTLLTQSADGTPATATVEGTRAPETELVLPYRGRQLRGDDLRRRLDDWAEAGVLEPTAVAAVSDVMSHPEWLRLEGRTVAVLGAGAEMGPLPSLLSWGATVAAVDLPRPALWQRLLDTARQRAGTLLMPVPPGGEQGSDAQLAQLAGGDLLTGVAEVSDWLGEIPGPLVVGNYAYADGAEHVRVSTAVDVLSQRLLARRQDVALAFLATPTDVFAVPVEAVQQSVDRYGHRSLPAKMVGRPLRTLTRGRLMQRAYLAQADPGICDSLVPVQGPNYALAKRIQRWRAAVHRAQGGDVSFHVAPSTRTRSVVKNRALSAAYAGARRFGVEIFEPETANTLMAALLVHDLHTPMPQHAHPWQDEAFAAVHGGLWRAAYAPRSVLGIAAVLGYASARK
jgi:hypothetical protein